MFKKEHFEYKGFMFLTLEIEIKTILPRYGLPHLLRTKIFLLSLNTKNVKGSTSQKVCQRLREAIIIQNRSKVGNHPTGGGGGLGFYLVFPT